MEYLTNITIMKEEKDSLVVVVTPKEFIGIEPVLEALDHAYTITAKRGSGYDWVFRLASMNVVVFGGPKETRAQRFRLELIR
jgi:hypothetical protein